MFDEQDRKYFYDEFKNNGYQVGSYDDFKKDLNNKEDRDWYYNEAKNMGYDVGTQADFDKMVLEATPSSPSPETVKEKTPAITQSQVQNTPVTQQPTVKQPTEEPEADEGGLQFNLIHIKKKNPKTGQMEDATTKDFGNDVLDKMKEIPNKMISAVSGLFGGPATDQVQQPQQAREVDAVTGAAPVHDVDAIYNKYVGKADALSETMYDLMASGQAQNQEEAQAIAMGAMNRAADRLAQRTTDEFVGKLGDNVANIDEAITNGWYSHEVQDKLKSMATQLGIMNNVAVDANGNYITQTDGYDQFINGKVKPAMVESLVRKYGESYRKQAEGVANRLYSHDEGIQNRLMNQDINDALASVIGKYVSPSVVDEYNKAQEAGSKAFSEGMEGSQYVPASLRLGTAIGAQYEANQAKDPKKTLNTLQKKFGKLYQNEDFLNDMSLAAYKVMTDYGVQGGLSGDPKQFKPMINAVLKNELDKLEVKGMMPKGSAEYIMKTGLGNTIVGKIARKTMQTDYQNWLEDIANQQYQPGFWENVASGALTFAGDAWSYWLPGAAGGKITKSMLAKAEGRLATDLWAKGMERKMAERAAKILVGKSKGMALKSGAAHGAATFGGQSAISKPIDEVYRTGQFDENGKIYNPSVGKILANTLGEVAKQSAIGAIMQGGTVANIIGKGRGLATNILADVGGKMVDSGIMTGQQMLERMAQDPNFKPTGKDAAESFLESMANLTAIGLPGMMGKYARFKDAREFNRKYDFTDQDITDLKRMGYDDLRDAFGKLGINGYRADGEGVQMMGQLTDKYMSLMNDKTVPEVLKAKMMAVVEGKRPSSFSPVIDSSIVQPMDNGGKVYLETLNKDGGIIDRKEYSSLAEAQKADKKLDYEKSLNVTSEYEKVYHTDALQDRMNTVYQQARDKYAAGEKLSDEDKTAIYLHQNAHVIGDIMQKQQSGMELSEQEQKLVNTYRHFYDSAFENSPIMKEYVRTFEDSQGVEHGALRKALEGDGKSRTAEQQKLVEEYQKQLYNDIVLKREMKQTVDDLYNATHNRGQERIEQSEIVGENPAEKPSEAPASSDVPHTEPPTPSVGGGTSTNAEGTPVEGSGASSRPKVASSDAFSMGQEAYNNGDVDGLQIIHRKDDLSKTRLRRAFANNEELMNTVLKAYEEGEDMDQFISQQSSLMTPVQQEAVRKYVEAQNAKKGVLDAMSHADDGYGEALKEQLWDYQTEDGNIVPVVMANGVKAFLKKANEYGGGFLVKPNKDGQPEIWQSATNDIKEMGTPIPFDEYINQLVEEQKSARQKQFLALFDGSDLKPGGKVYVAMEAGDEPMQLTFAGYSEDGKIVLSDGKENIPLTKDEFNAWRQNALETSIGTELDAEDAQRAEEDAAQAEAEKKQRFADGIVGLSEQKPDYSSTETDPKVAAEYLQEQYSDDHGKLMSLIAGSRSDIKEQLDNKRKTASEYEEWLSTNADLDPDKARTVESELALVNEQIADLEARYNNWNTIRKEVMTPEEVRTLRKERKAEIEKAGVDESATTPSYGYEVAALDNEELRKQCPTMEEANDYIASQRKAIYKIQKDEIQPQIDEINNTLEQYMNGDVDYSAEQLRELNTTKAQLVAAQDGFSATARKLKAQASNLEKIYSHELNAKAMEELGMTPSEQRKALVADAFKKNNLGAIKEIYKDSSVDITDLTPQTLEEAVSEGLRPHSLNAESLQSELGTDNFKYGIGKGYDSNKYNYLLAKKGTGLTVGEFATRVWNDLPINLRDLGYTDQDVRNTLLGMLKSYDNVKEMRNVALMNRIAAAEEELSAEEDWYEAQKERELIERQAEKEEYEAYLQGKALSLPTESELNEIMGMEYDRMMEIEHREREYREYVKSILPELADYDDRSNEEGYGGGSGLGSDSSRRGAAEGNRQGKEVGGREATSQSESGKTPDKERTGRQATGGMERGEGPVGGGAHLSQETSFGERLRNAIAETEPNPSEAQKKAGNYKKGHLQFGGYDFTVETPKGATRSGVDEQGKPWSVTMHDTYGYIKGKIGVDGDHIDMFINDAADLDTFDGNVFVIDQVNPKTGEFDEHKVMYGYPSEEDAKKAYLQNYSPGWKGLGEVTSVPKATFDKWLQSSDRKTKPFADYAMVKNNQIRFSKVSDEQAQLDADYLEAVNRGDMETAQRMVNEAAEAAGYSTDSSYQGTSAFNGAAPWGNAYFLTKEERKEAWDNDEYDGDQTLGDYIHRGIDAMNLDFIALDPRNYRAADVNRKEAISNVRNAIQKKSKTITMYRSVPADVKESTFRNGDWVTPSRGYAVENAEIHGWGDDYNIIEQKVPVDEIWWDGNDIAEWGYGREEDYVNDTDFAYKNTKNNRKLLDAVTYDDNGDVIPLSQRFNSRKSDERYQKGSSAMKPTHQEEVLRDAVIDKLREGGMDVITDVEEGQRVLDAANGNVRQQAMVKNLSKAANTIKNWLSNNRRNQFFSLELPEETQKEIRNKLGRDFDSHIISANNVAHAKINHGVNGKKITSNSIPLRDEDFELIPYIMTKPSYVERGSEDVTGRESIRFYKNLSNGYAVVVEKEQKNSPNDMETITMWAEKSSSNGADAHSKTGTSPAIDARNVIISTEDAAKIRKDAETAIENDRKMHENAEKSANGAKFFVTPDGEAYGYTVDGKIYIDPRIANSETPIHEYAHLWAEAVRSENPKEWENIVNLMRGLKPVWDKVKKEYPHLKTDNDLADEVLAQYSGKRGAERLRKEYDAIVEGDDSITEKAKDMYALQRLKKVLAKFWKKVADFLHIHFTTAEEVADRVMKDLLDGVDPRKVAKDARASKAKDADKTLVGVHNITEEKLRKALKLGGFANPSVAVIDTGKSAHNSFGEISFIAPSALVDKRTGGTAGTWTTDAYTQRYPSVERQMSEKGYQKFEKWVDGLDYPDSAKMEIKRQAKDALEDNRDPAWELMYLKENGIDIKGYDSKVNYLWEDIIEDHPAVEDILESMKSDPKLNEDVTKLAKSEITAPIWRNISQEVSAQMSEELGRRVSTISPKVRAKTKEIFERDYAPSLFNKDGSPKKADVKKVVAKMVQQYEDTKEYSFYKSKVRASSYVHNNGMYSDYIRWQENKLDDFGTKNRLFRGYKNEGTRKYVPETLENVSKAMRDDAEGQTNGSEYTTFGSFIAKLADRVDSTDEMRANKDKLSSNEDKQDFYEKWEEVYYDLAKFLYNDVAYGEQRLHDIVTKSDPKKYAKKEYGITLTPTFMKNLDALKKAVREELKSNYFETKFERPVHLDEFVAAVVPNDLGADVRKGLEESGLRLYDYDAKKEGDRQRAFDKAIRGGDNIRFSLAGERGAANMDRTEEVTTRLDNLSVARKMEEEKKDAKAIKLATGWERGADGKWRYEIPDIEYVPSGEADLNHRVEMQPWGKEYTKLTDRMFDGDTLTDAEMKRFEELSEKAKEVADLYKGLDKKSLADYVRADDLFKAYPELRAVNVEFVNRDATVGGSYSDVTNTIYVNENSSLPYEEVFAHEIQHAIQHIEGFAKGGSVEMFHDPNEQDRLFAKFDNLVREKFGNNDIETLYGILDGTTDEYRDFVQSLGDEYNQTLKALRATKKYTSEKDFKQLYDRDVKEANKPSAYTQYRSLAGEVEARNVQARLGMTDEQRRNSLASETEDVNRDEQIVMNGDGASYSIVEDPKTIEKLDKEETVKVYRAMQLGEDGKLYPPMAAKVKGKFVQPIELGKWEQADERPDLADKNGLFTLNKGNGKTLKAAYNPYLHTSRTPLNDQFSEAQSRPNIVTVEVEVPKSELTSGYRAEKAKDAVGEVEWKAGIIQGQLTGKRKVILSRWDKPVRIVPDSEVADVIVNDMFKDKKVVMPTNVVTPSLRKELEKRGVPFVETDNRGRIVGGENDGVHYSKVYGKKAGSKLALNENPDTIGAKEQRIQKLRDSEPIRISGTEIPSSEDLKQYKKNALEYGKTLQGTYTNKDDGTTIQLQRGRRNGGVREVLQHNYKDIPHLQSVAAIPQIIENSIYIDSRENQDKAKNPDVSEYRYYVCGLKIGKEDYTVRSVVAVDKNGNRYYDHKLTDIEKGKLLDYLNQEASYHVGFGTTPSTKLTTDIFIGKDTVLKSILQTNKQEIAKNVQNVANVLGGAEANVYTSLDDVPEEYQSEVEQGAKGWYDPETHTVHIYLPNCADANEAQRTVFHEKIGHEGMEVLLGGESGVRKFANFVYKSVGKKLRGKILDFANKYDPDWKNPDRMNVGTQEYIAHLAEEGPVTAEDFSLWTKIKHYLIKALKKLGIRVPGLLNDKDLRYYLMKAGKALHVWDNMPKAKQEAMMAQASNADIKDALSDGAGKGKPRQKKDESAIQYMKRVMEWRRWKEAREDENDPEPPQFYDFDKDVEGKKEWEQLNKDWRDAHGLKGDEMPIRPERKEGETDEDFMSRYKDWEKWNNAMTDKDSPMPDMFAFEKEKQKEASKKYEDWLARHELLDQQQADLDLYEGKIYPAETNPEADALEQRVMQDLAEVTSTDVSKEGAARTVKHAVIHRRKNMEEASADDAIYINDVKNRIEKMADSGVFDKLLADYQGKPNKAEKLAEAIPYIIEAPRRLRDIAHDLNNTGAFDKGHLHIQPEDVEDIQPFVSDLTAETYKKHIVVKNGEEVEVYDDPQAVGELASKMAQAINANHQGEEDFVPIDGTDILNDNVLPLVRQKVVPEGIDYKNITPEMQATLDSIRDWYNYTYDWLKDNHTLREDTGFNADYVNHLWDKEKSDKQAYATYVENRQRTKSPNEKPRTISTLMEGISVGLVPKTTDITKMMAYYSRSNIEAYVNKTMLQELSGLSVIERNEEGDIISSDPLLSSTAPINLEQYRYFEIPGVGPVWVYNVSPKQVKVKNPISGKEKVLYSEASAGDRFGVVFDTYQSSPFWKAFDTLASSAKKLELGFSGFHAGALTEVYMVQNAIEFGPKKALAHFMKYIFGDTVKNHELPCFANPEDFQEAASHLVKFGATNDYAAADVQNMFDNFRDSMMKIQEKLGSGNVLSKAGATVSLPLKVASQMLSLVNKGMDRALWDFLHDGLKLATYRMRAEKTKERAKKYGWTAEQLSKALDEDGQFVNDMFGGQHWDVLGASHRTLRYAGRVLLSPDWNASTTRHFLALTGYGSVWNEATVENFRDYYKRLWGATRGKSELKPEDWGRTTRQLSSLLCYGLGFMVFYEAFANGINAAFRAMDEEKEREKAEEIRKTNPDYKSPYELAYPDGMKWYDYLMRGNTLGQQSKIFVGRYADGTEMYVRHGKQFREVPEYLFNHKGELEFPGPMVQRMIGKANPMVRMTLDDINYLSDFQASHADQELQQKYGKTIGLLYKDALYWAPFLIPSQDNKEFKAVDFFFPSSKGFSPWKAQDYFKNFILSGDMEGVMMTYQSCQKNGVDAEKQLQAAISSIKALEAKEMQDGVVSLQIASERFDGAKSVTEKRKMREKMRKFLAQGEYKAFTQQEAMDMVKEFQEGVDPKEMLKTDNKYLNVATSADVTEDWRIQQVRASTKGYADKLSELKDTDKAKMGAFRNAHANVFKARKAISKATAKMNKLKKKLGEGNDAAILKQIRAVRKDLLKDLNGMEHLKEYKE